MRLKLLVVAGAMTALVGSAALPTSADVYCERLSPCINVSDETVVEPDSGSRQMVFEVTLSTAATIPVVVEYHTVAGTAHAGSDYVAQQSGLVFNADEYKKSIVVDVLGDVQNEPRETFFLEVTHASQAQIQDGRGQGTIVDNDPNGPPPPPTPTLPTCLSARPRC